MPNVSTVTKGFETFNSVVEDHMPNVQCARIIKAYKLQRPIKPAILGITRKWWNSHGFRPLGTRMIWLSPDDCRDILINHRYIHNRRISDQWAEELSQDLLYCKLDFGYVGGFPRLANGHHSLLAGLNQNRDVVGEITLWECRNDEAFSWLFSTFDSNKKRTFPQIVKVHSQVAKSVPDAPAYWWSKVASSARQATMGFQKTKTSTNLERLSISEDRNVINFTNIFYSLANNCGLKPNSRLIPNAVIACFFAAWVSQPVKAKQFMKQYLTGEELRSGMPAHSLREKIGNRPAKEHAANSFADFVTFTYLAWLAFKGGQKISKSNLRKKSNLQIPHYTKW